MSSLDENVKIIEIKPDDIIIVIAPRTMIVGKGKEYIQMQLKRIFGDRKILVVGDDIKFAFIKNADKDWIGEMINGFENENS